MQLNPYLTFKGQCEAAFKFYEKVLGGKIEAFPTRAHRPRSTGNRMAVTCCSAKTSVSATASTPNGR